MSTINIKSARIDYGAINVLSDLNLDVGAGEFLVLLGSSGCGKSTLLGAIAGLIDLSSGQIHIGGRNVTWAEPKDRGIGMVFQSYALYPRMTVEGNMSFGLKMAGMAKAEIAQRVERAAAILKITDLLKRRPSELSGGQRQRVAIGRALVRQVDVFLFDEPLSNLDAKLRTELRVEIKRLHQELGNTMIYVTHDQVEAMTLADRIAVMRNGRIEQLDTPEAIYARPVNRFVAGFVGSPSMNIFPVLTDADGPSARGPGVNANLAAYAFARPLLPGQPVELGVRPEHFVLGDAMTAQPLQFDFVVDVIENMGADSYAWGHVGSTPVAVRTLPGIKLMPGQAIRIGAPIDYASVFDAQSGERL